MCVSVVFLCVQSAKGEEQEEEEEEEEEKKVRSTSRRRAPQSLPLVRLMIIIFMPYNTRHHRKHNASHCLVSLAVG